MKRLVVIWIPLFFAACTLIYDDLSVCGEELVVDYQLQLHTELSMQLQTELMTEAEEPVRYSLGKWLAPIFTDKAKDVDLRFYSGATDEIRHQIQEEINDQRTSYTIRLPQEDYMHLGVANIEDNHAVRLTGGAHSETMELALTDDPEIPSLNTGVFTARMPMSVGDTSARFEVHLYMATCAVALVVDTTLCDSLVSMYAILSGSASRFALRDSVYSYDGGQKIVCEEVAVTSPAKAPARTLAPTDSTQTDTYSCFAASMFPTADDRPWELVVETTLRGNRHTTTTMTIDEPVQAGTLRILRVYVDGKGAVLPDKGQEMAVTVSLDWKQGGEHDIEL